MSNINTTEVNGKMQERKKRHSFAKYPCKGKDYRNREI